MHVASYSHCEGSLHCSLCFKFGERGFWIDAFALLMQESNSHPQEQFSFQAGLNVFLVISMTTNRCFLPIRNELEDDMENGVSTVCFKVCLLHSSTSFNKFYPDLSGRVTFGNQLFYFTGQKRPFIRHKIRQTRRTLDKPTTVTTA